MQQQQFHDYQKITKIEKENTLSIWSNSVFPLNSGSFDNSSAIMQPKDHISIAVEYCFVPNKSSGALYQKNYIYTCYKQL